ncbi:MAG TPA: cytochrome c biogenesis protein CcdA [Armatimonadota bacterium]
MAVLVSSAKVHAQPGGPAESPSATVRIEPVTLRLARHAPAEFTVRVTPPSGHHAYLDAGKDGTLLPIDITLAALAQAGLQVRPVSKPKGEWDGQFAATVLRREGAFRYQVTAPATAQAGTHTYAVTVRSQVCNDANGACYFPHVDVLHLQVAIGTGTVPAASNVLPRKTSVPVHQAAAPTVGAVRDSAPTNSASHAAPRDDSQYTPRTSQPGHGLLVWLLLAFVAGLLMNIMPCVLPVVSIKVISFVQQAGESRRRVLAMGLLFAAGMLTVFLALALAAILFGLGWGQQFQSQAFLITLIALVFAFALSLFGVYEFGMPITVGTLAATTTREGLGSVYLKGVLATLLATPCSGPLLGSTLAWTLTQPPVTVLAMFSMLGLGMALPYVVLTAHPALLTRLPKPGPWMETFKQIMGFLLVGTVAYLMISLDHQLLLLTVILLVFVALGAWIWGRFSLQPRSAVGRTMVLASALLIVGIGAYLSFHTLRDVLQPATGTAVTALTWEPFDPVKLHQYQQEGRSVMLDFSADWCANCTFNEVRVYNAAAVRQLLREKNVIVMKADLTREGPTTATIRQLMGQLGARSIPFLAVFPGDQPMQPYTLYDLVDKEQMRNVLHQLPTVRNMAK